MTAKEAKATKATKEATQAGATLKALSALNKMKKANKLVQLYFHKQGPRSYKRGVGALLVALASTKKGEQTQNKLTSKLGLSRKDLKSVVKKARRKGFVTIEDDDKKKTYTVKLTDEGKKVAKKRDEAQNSAATELASVLTTEELEQLESICEKLILSAKDAGISGKKKGRKFHAKRKHAHHKHCCHEHRHGHHHGHGCGHEHERGHGCGHGHRH